MHEAGLEHRDQDRQRFDPVGVRIVGFPERDRIARPRRTKRPASNRWPASRSRSLFRSPERAARQDALARARRPRAAGAHGSVMISGSLPASQSVMAVIVELFLLLAGRRRPDRSRSSPCSAPAQIPPRERTAENKRSKEGRRISMIAADSNGPRFYRALRQYIEVPRGKRVDIAAPYCRDMASENSPLRMRAARPSAKRAAASSP